MEKEKLKKKTHMLYNRVYRDINSGRTISLNKCNNYVYSLESLKDDLEDSGFDFNGVYEEIENVELDIIDDEVDDEIIQETMEDIEEQLERILEEFGIDVTEGPSSSSSPNHQPIHVTVSPTISPTISAEATAKANIDIKMEIKKLEDEFNKEAERMFPNKTKLQKIINNLKEYGHIALPVVQKLTEKLAGMFLF